MNIVIDILWLIITIIVGCVLFVSMFVYPLLYFFQGNTNKRDYDRNK